jgi:replication-associated recombination protein RarA
MTTTPSFKDLLEKTKSASLETRKSKDAEKEKVEKPEEKPEALADIKPKTDQMLTKNGYDVFEVMSALQKMIRRGKEGEAMFWAFEMESFNSTWLWKRLMVITTEDVGPADPSIPVLVKTLWDTYDRMKDMAKGKQPESHILGMAVLSLCRAKKSHEAMYLPMTVNWHRKYLGWKIEIPDVALDIHTKRGKKMGRGRNHWYSEGFRINNHEEIDGDKWGNAFRVGDEVKYNLLEADDYYYHKHNGEYHHTEEDDLIDPETGLPMIGTYDREKV